MTPLRDDPPSVAVTLAASLERHGISYAIGGALAYSFWGIPRATLDVDLTVFVEVEALDVVFAALGEAGLVVEPDGARAAVDKRGMFEVMLGPLPLDVRGHQVSVAVPHYLE